MILSVLTNKKNLYIAPKTTRKDIHMKPCKYSIFIEILEAGSFSKAAEKINYSQSAISQLVSSLEKELNVPLLHRSKKGLSLTTEGEQLLPYFYDIHKAEIRLQDVLAQKNDHLTGTVRIGAYTSISCSFLPKVIQSFQEKYPLVDYQIINGSYKDIEELIINGGVDLGFVRWPMVHQLDYHHFQPDNLVVVMPNTHPLASNTNYPISNLIHEDFVLLDDGYTEELLKFFKNHNAMPRIKYKVKGNLALFGYISNGLGISIIPEASMKVAPATLKYLHLTPPLYRSLAIACKDKKNLSTVNRMFFDEIISFDSDFISNL